MKLIYRLSVLKAILLFQVVSVQCLLITDHVSTYTLFNYMDVNIDYQRHRIRISFDNGSANENPCSFKTAAYKMSKYVGNTGESSGTYHWIVTICLYQPTNTIFMPNHILKFTSYASM